MNRFSIVSLLLGFCLFHITQAQATTLPSIIAKRHYAHFSNSKILSWTNNNLEDADLFLVSFEMDDLKHEAFYHPSGKLLTHLSHYEEFPEHIQQYIHEAFPKSEIRRLVLRRQYSGGQIESQTFTALIKTPQGITTISLRYEDNGENAKLIAEQ